MDIDFRNCDYKELIKDLLSKDIKVDLLLTDPPYGVSRDYQLGFSNMGRAGMNYGEWDYGFDQTEWEQEAREGNLDRYINMLSKSNDFDWAGMSDRYNA